MIYPSVSNKPRGLRRTANLNKRRLKFHGLLPAGRPQIIASQSPVFAILWKIGVKPWRDSHHVWFPAQGSLPSQVGRRVFPYWAMGPRIPAERSIDILLRNAPGSTASPIGHEETACIRLYRRPIPCRVCSFKC